MRDAKRSVAYLAERDAFDGTPLARSVGPERLREVAQTTLDWLGFNTTIQFRHGQFSWCNGWKNTIQFTPNAYLSTVAHEIAHMMDYRAGTTVQGHGAPWRGWFVALVNAMHGYEYADALAAGFAKYGLDWIDPGLPGRPTPLIVETVERGGWIRKPLTHAPQLGTIAL